MGQLSCTVPDWDIVLLHKLHLSVIHLSDICILIPLSHISSNPVRETKATVIVYRIYTVWKNLIEPRKVHAERVSLEEQDVVWINGSDNGYDAVIERQ